MPKQLPNLECTNFSHIHKSYQKLLFNTTHSFFIPLTIKHHRSVFHYNNGNSWKYSVNFSILNKNVFKASKHKRALWACSLHFYFEIHTLVIFVILYCASWLGSTGPFWPGMMATLTRSFLCGAAWCYRMDETVGR